MFTLRWSARFIPFCHARCPRAARLASARAIHGAFLYGRLEVPASDRIPPGASAPHRRLPRSDQTVPPPDQPPPQASAPRRGRSSSASRRSPETDPGGTRRFILACPQRSLGS